LQNFTHLALSNCRFNVSSRGHAASPHNNIRDELKRLKTVHVSGPIPKVDSSRDSQWFSTLLPLHCEEVEEYHSSALCSSCHGYLALAVVNNLQKSGKKKTVRPWGLKFCPREGIIWNRDKNSCRNLLWIMTFTKASGHRPPGYRQVLILRMQPFRSPNFLLSRPPPADLRSW